jgi:uncharacterized protein DUF2188
VRKVPVLPSTIHVQPNAEGRWIVRHENDREAHSEHESATEAERVARELANAEGATRVLLRDRYGRVRDLRDERPTARGTRARDGRIAHP